MTPAHRPRILHWLTLKKIGSPRCPMQACKYRRFVDNSSWVIKHGILHTFCCSATISSRQSLRNSRFFSSRGRTPKCRRSKSLVSATVSGSMDAMRAVARGELRTWMGISSNTSFQATAASRNFSVVKFPSLYTCRQCGTANSSGTS